MYNYWWGDEEILSSQVIVTRIEKSSVYEILFIQEGFNEECFLDITTSYKLINKTISSDIKHEFNEIQTKV